MNKIKRIAEDGKKMGDVYVYTGMGVGKATNALGLALRTVGWGKIRYHSVFDWKTRLLVSTKLKKN